MLKGFTLIELAIVLVVSSILIIGILGGQSIIQSSKVSSQVSQLTQFDKATNLFKLEFDALPGDMKRQDAIDYGFSVAGSNHLYVHNGNGIINMRGTGSAPLCPRRTWEGISTCSYEFLGEQEFFFVHLSEAELLDVKLVGWSAPGPAWEPYVPDHHYPETKIGGRAITSASDMAGKTHYIVGIDHANRTTYTFGREESFRGFVPEIASRIDKKADDGVPNRGKLKAIRWDDGIRVEGVAGRRASAPYHSLCVTDVNADKYNLSETEPSCVLWVRSGS